MKLTYGTTQSLLAPVETVAVPDRTPTVLEGGTF